MCCGVNTHHIENDYQHRGYTFVNIVMKPDAGDTRYRIDLRRYADVVYMRGCVSADM